MPELGKRVSSTANRMGRAWTARLLRVFICMDILLVLCAALVFSMWHENQALGEWKWNTHREIVWEERAYRFCGEDGLWHAAQFGPIMDAAKPAAVFFVWAQLIGLFWQNAWGAKAARKTLKPLNKMAEMANEILKRQASAPKPDEPVDLHELEEAIGKINPGDRLRTGDAELEGIENAINAMLARTQESYRQQARFVSDASHELRTPIAVIQGYAGMLKRWGKEDETVLDEAIEAIASESDYMKKLVEQLLFLARGDTGRARMEPVKLNIAEIVQEARDDAALIDKAHEWKLGRCEDAFVVADANMLKQSVRILTENAARYTGEKGAVRLQAMRKGDTACIEVQDTGSGISGKDMQHIFERFYRADEARSRENGGSGLGLSIAQWIVESHGGHFEVFSREGLGTRFTIVLPLAKGNNA